jgi:hypothetical protein
MSLNSGSDFLYVQDLVPGTLYGADVFCNCPNVTLVLSNVRKGNRCDVTILNCNKEIHVFESLLYDMCWVATCNVVRNLNESDDLVWPLPILFLDDCGLREGLDTWISL